MPNKNNRNKKRWLIFSLLFSCLLVLGGCVIPTKNTGIVEHGKEVMEAPMTKDVIMYVGDIVDGLYIFNGFIREDTFVFSSLDYQYFHPAKIGYEFGLHEASSVEYAEVLDFNRDEGWIKLRLVLSK